MYRYRLILTWSLLDIVMLHHYLTLDSNVDSYEDSNQDYSNNEFNQHQSANKGEKNISHLISYNLRPDSNYDSYEDSNQDYQIKTAKEDSRNVSNLISKHLKIDSNLDPFEYSNQDYLHEDVPPDATAKDVEKTIPGQIIKNKTQEERENPHEGKINVELFKEGV